MGEECMSIKDDYCYYSDDDYDIHDDDDDDASLHGDYDNLETETHILPPKPPSTKVFLFFYCIDSC